MNPTPEKPNPRSVAAKKRWADPAQRAKQSEATKAQWDAPGSALRAANTKTGQSGRGQRSPTYHAWVWVVAVCTRATHPQFPLYGGAGTTVSPTWVGDSGFETFYKDMGDRPEGTKITLIDSTGNFEPGNTKWVPEAKAKIRQKESKWLTEN
jgi:hypothetical protein